MTTLMTRFHWTIFLTIRPKVENNETSFLSTSEKLESRLTSDCSDSVVLNVDRAIWDIYIYICVCVLSPLLSGQTFKQQIGTHSASSTSNSTMISSIEPQAVQECLSKSRALRIKFHQKQADPWSTKPHFCRFFFAQEGGTYHCLLRFKGSSIPGLSWKVYQRSKDLNLWFEAPAL